MKHKLQAMLDAGHDDALLRFSLGRILLREGDVQSARHHLAEAVTRNPQYSAAWKLYGQAQAANNEPAAAAASFDKGIAAAREHGDLQSVKEMQVFRKRALKKI